MHLSTRSSARLGDIPNAAPRSGLVATETAKPGLILRSGSQRNVSREWVPPPSPRAGSDDMKTDPATTSETHPSERRRNDRDAAGQSSPLRGVLVGGKMAPDEVTAVGGCTNWLRDEANCRRVRAAGTGEALSCGERLVAIRHLRRERRLNGLAGWLAERFPYI